MKMHKHFYNVNYKQGLVVIPNIYKVNRYCQIVLQEVASIYDFTVVFMLYKHAFSIPSSSIWKKKLLCFNFLTELLAIWMVRNHSPITLFGLHFFYYQISSTFPSVF